jgi:hypothetical protein
MNSSSHVTAAEAVFQTFGDSWNGSRTHHLLHAAEKLGRSTNQTTQFISED